MYYPRRLPAQYDSVITYYSYKSLTYNQQSKHTTKNKQKISYVFKGIYVPIRNSCKFAS